MCAGNSHGCRLRWAVSHGEWWRARPFSEGLARFSRPLVALTDAFVGEDHGMRVDVTSTTGEVASAVHAHESFRTVVANLLPPQENQAAWA